MTRSRKLAFLRWIIVGMFFIAHFFYFAIFNRYHLSYQEQIQLFRIDWNFLTSFLTKPGGLAECFGAFFIQFYLNPITGVFIVTLGGIAAYALAGYIFRKYKIFGILWSFIPVLLLVALQSDHIYNLGYTIGFLLALIFIALYISIHNDKLRYATGFIGWFFLYLATGGFSLLATVLCIIHELLFIKNRYRLFISLGYLLMTALLPYLTCHYIYFLPITNAWLSPILFPGNLTTKYGLLLLLSYFPLLLIVIKIWLTLSKKKQILFGWNWKTILIGIIVILAFSGWIKEYAYDFKNELFFGINYSVQQEKWDQVLKLSSRYPETNSLILYYTNLALYKSGLLGDLMFHYNQVGVPGLWPEWKGNWASAFYGGEIFYHLGYINEAYRWAFEAMVINASPRLLKRLVMTSLINGDSEIAEKYLNVLDQTLFYRKWVQHYRNYIINSKLLIQDQEIAEKRHLLIYTDFIADVNNLNIVLYKLLENHPDNRMAFEYYMASLLLDKNITTFAANINRIKDFGYKEIPVHYEEALLIYMDYSKKNIIPKGYLIRKSTIQRFKDYVNTYSSYSANPNLRAQALNKPYGKTYWFYFHFINK